ncbi:MAG: hypothetical protein IID30_11555 [Planctomycetes bacterium]|nr:hypothetical protein [Planctomycetota bacterium]
MTTTVPESPTALSLLIADQIYQDCETGNHVIAGTFNTLYTPKVPFRYPHISVFFQVTNISSPVDLRIRLEHAEEGETIFEAGGPISANSPLHVHSQKMALKNVQFKYEGKYWFQLLSSEEILILAPLYIIIKPASEAKEGEKP